MSKRLIVQIPAGMVVSRVKVIRVVDGWEESKHPRSENGQFGEGGGGEAKPQPSKQPSTKAEESLGPEIRGFEGKWDEAVAHLRELNKLENVGGVAIGVLHHPALSAPIDIPWGKPGTGKKDGYGLSKIIRFHPEVLNDLPDRLKDMVVEKNDDGYVVLRSKNTLAVIQLKWFSKDRHWLVTAYEPDPAYKERRRLGNIVSRPKDH